MGARHQAEEMRRQAAAIREEVDHDFDDDGDDDDDDDDDVVGLGGDLAQVDGVSSRSQDPAGDSVAAEISEISDSSSDVNEDLGDIREEARNKESGSVGDRPRLGSQSVEALTDVEYQGPPEMVSNLRGGGGPAGGNFLSLPGFSSQASVSSGQVLAAGKDLVFSREQGRRKMLGEDMMVR